MSAITTEDMRQDMNRDDRMRAAVLFFNKKYKCKWDKVYEAFTKMEKVDKDDRKKIVEEYKNTDTTKWITLLDDDYPDKYKDKNFHKPPFVIKLDIATGIRTLNVYE